MTKVLRDEIQRIASGSIIFRNISYIFFVEFKKFHYALIVPYNNVYQGLSSAGAIKFPNSILS